MKINISIEILPSEVSTILEQLKSQGKTSPPEGGEESPYVKIVRVADNEMNRSNEFWKGRIGQLGSVCGERGGMWDVQFNSDPFPCKDIDPQRFTDNPT